MNQEKCRKLKEEISAQPPPQIVEIRRFFDGNDDLGSIGCNLYEHPGIDVFRDTLTGLLERPDVDCVFAQIWEADPGEDSWPFADVVLVAGTISANDLRTILEPLEPDEIGDASSFGAPESILEKHPAILAVWWD